MKTSIEAIGWYNKSNALWESKGLPIRFSSNHKNEKVDFNTAKIVIRGFWKSEMKSKLPYDIREGSGNRSTWVHYDRKNKGTRRVLTINTESGWPNIIHDFGHWMGYRKNLSRPHCVEHAIMEWRFTKYVFNNDYIKKSRKAILESAKKTLKKDIVQMRYEAMLKREELWGVKLRRATNGHAKVLKELKEYERTHGERLTKV